MANPKFTITKDVSVGIWNDEQYIARVYADKIIVESPCVKWVNNCGSLAVSKEAIRNPGVISAVLADLADDCEQTAWEKIGNALNDQYLAAW